MSNEKAVSQHYTHGDLVKAIEASIAKLGKTVDSVTIDDLAAVDEFHIGGRPATGRFMDQLDFSEQDHILDVGCGLGGASRFVANRYNSRVSGIDLTEEYIDAGKTLSSWVGLDQRVTLHQGSALSMPFEDGMFDGGFMMHVGMNIADKAGLFAETYRVLRSGALFGVYDVMRIEEGELAYPVPWATVAATSNLATPNQYGQALRDAGFEVFGGNNRRDFALSFFAEQRAKVEASGGPPPLGLHTLIGESAPMKFQNLVQNIKADLVSPVEMIVQKP